MDSTESQVKMLQCLCDIEVLKESRRGMQREIDERHNAIHHLIRYYEGDVKNFIKPPQDKTRIERECLRMRREIKRLKVIKAELNLIIEVKQLNYA